MSKQSTTKELTATNLKNALWETLTALRDDEITCGQADAVASQAREILRTTNTQLRISQQTKRNVPTSVIDFSEKD